MKLSALWKPLLAPALGIILFPGCSLDDPVPPTAPALWQEVTLDLMDGDSRMMAVDFNGGYGMAMAVTAPAKAGAEHRFFRLRPDGSWLQDDLEPLPGGMVAMDLALDTTGKPVLAGYQMPGLPSIVFDLRGPQPVATEQASYGMLTVAGEGTFMVAGGRSNGGGLWTSAGPGQWNFDILPLTRTNDSGFRDIDIRDGRAVACGYDDGADTLKVILTRTSATDWEKIPAGGPSTATYLCVAQTGAGTLFVGGMVGAGGSAPRAFLSQRAADGSWADLILPDAEGLHGVMDILIAADGSIYLACMGEGDQTRANLIHAGPTGVFPEITPFPGGLLQVDQAADGSIYAVGFRRNPVDGATRGVMLVKSP